MSKHELKHQDGETHTPLMEQRGKATGAQGRQADLLRWLSAALAIVAIIAATGLPAAAQSGSTQATAEIPCTPPGQPLVKVPELFSVGGKLHATIVLSDENVRMTFRQPYRQPDNPSNLLTRPSNTAVTKCYPQHVRIFRGLGATPAAPAPTNGYTDPLPGPTLRARVGDLVQLTFINQINTSNFPYSMDEGEKDDCDQVAGVYPGSDNFPDCFHGSSTGNIHFHGTHTNPNTTGDNVLLEIRPSTRLPDGTPRVTPDSVKKSFDKFFANCETELNKNVLSEWPKMWSDLPAGWTDEQKQLLKDYDTEMEKKYGSKFRKLWPIDAKQLEQGAWPQFYIGAYPYCFRLPNYTASTFPPPVDHAMHHGGAGTAEDADIARPLMMGQAPGTHWYHAHKHGSTAINVANGMTGAFIIEGKYDDDLNDWYGKDWTRTQPLMVINQLGVSTNLMRKSQQIDKGPDFSVNGRLRPVVSMKPGEVQMWRILNTSGRAGAYFAAPPKGFHWMQLAQDGVQFNDVNYQNSLDKPILLASGNRADLLVKAPDSCVAPNDCTLWVQNEVDPGDLATASQVTFLTVNITGDMVKSDSKQGQFIPKAPSFPPYLADIPAGEVTGKKRLMFATIGNQGGPPNPPKHTIDGRQFDGEVGAVVLLNTTEEWTVLNTTPNISHPFHIHINPFQVVEVFEPNAMITDPTTNKQVNKYVFDRSELKVTGQCLLDRFNSDTWKPCDAPEVKSNLIWWDVFPIPSGRQVNTTPKLTTDPTTHKPTVVLDANGKVVYDQVTVPGYFKMRSRFVDYSGYYVLHCHILAHEDRGMMTIVEVAPARTPYSHH